MHSSAISFAIHSRFKRLFKKKEGIGLVKVFVGWVLLVIGFIAFYNLWPRSIDLPKIGTVEGWSLTEVSGKDVSTSKKPKLVTFFFTNCPDICPSTMWQLKDLEQIMKERGVLEEEYLIVNVTLDPKYDTVERILQYKEMFGITSPNWYFFRGSEVETKKFTHYFNFFYEREEGGFVTHSTSMFVVDTNDQIRASHDMAIGNTRVNLEQIADHLQQLLH